MYEKFTTRTRRVVILAQEEAKAFNHGSIGPEHILLGLIREGEAVAAQVLRNMGVGLEDVRLRVKELVGLGDAPVDPRQPMSFTPSGAKVLESANQESLQRGRDYIGTEHLLLGLVRDNTSVASQILVGLGADLGRVAQATDELVQQYLAR
ncbi:MAG: hypothetical protein IRZ07_13195 [Microbispora sp.]|nr:hypothetical protein [Microbispora sp.]